MMQLFPNLRRFTQPPSAEQLVADINSNRNFLSDPKCQATRQAQIDLFRSERLTIEDIVTARLKNLSGGTHYKCDEGRDKSNLKPNIKSLLVDFGEAVLPHLMSHLESETILGDYNNSVWYSDIEEGMKLVREHGLADAMAQTLFADETAHQWSEELLAAVKSLASVHTVDPLLKLTFVYGTERTRQHAYGGAMSVPQYVDCVLSSIAANQKISVGQLCLEHFNPTEAWVKGLRHGLHRPSKVNFGGKLATALPEITPLTELHLERYMQLLELELIPETAIVSIESSFAKRATPLSEHFRAASLVALMRSPSLSPSSLIEMRPSLLQLADSNRQCRLLLDCVLKLESEIRVHPEFQVPIFSAKLAHSAVELVLAGKDFSVKKVDAVHDKRFEKVSSTKDDPDAALDPNNEVSGKYVRLKTEEFESKPAYLEVVAVEA